MTNWPHKQCIKYLNASLKTSKWHMVVQGDSSDEKTQAHCVLYARLSHFNLFFNQRLFIYLFIYYFPTIKITQALHYTKMWRGDLRKPQGLYEEAPSLQ